MYVREGIVPKRGWSKFQYSKKNDQFINDDKGQYNVKFRGNRNGGQKTKFVEKL